MGYGMKGHISVQFQNSYGTSLTTSLHGIPIISESLVLNRAQLVEQGMYGRFAESPYHHGAHEVGGSISMEAGPTAIGHWFKAAFGQITTTSDTGIQSHVFLPVTADFDDRAAVRPLTIEAHRDTGSASLFYDCLVSQLSMNIANGELLTVDVDIMGAGFSRKAAGSPTYPDNSPFQWRQGSASLGGASLADFRNLTVTLNNNLEYMHTITSSGAPYRIVRSGQQQIEVTGSLVFATHSEYTAFLDETEQQLKLHLVGKEAPNALTIDIPKLRFKTFEPVMGGPGRVEAGFTAQAIYSADSATALRFTLINTQVLY